VLRGQVSLVLRERRQLGRRLPLLRLAQRERAAHGEPEQQGREQLATVAHEPTQAGSAARRRQGCLRESAAF
jgi:hypothetical protein